jgi:hypothetical protein
MTADQALALGKAAYAESGVEAGTDTAQGD